MHPPLRAVIHQHEVPAGGRRRDLERDHCRLRLLLQDNPRLAIDMVTAEVVRANEQVGRDGVPDELDSRDVLSQGQSNGVMQFCVRAVQVPESSHPLAAPVVTSCSPGLAAAGLMQPHGPCAAAGTAVMSRAEVQAAAKTKTRTLLPGRQRPARASTPRPTPLPA